MKSPQFPVFQKIQLHDKQTFDKYVNAFPLYSDFNFVSLWSWNLDDEIKFTYLNGNLVIELADYVDNSPFITFLGQQKVLDTSDQLLRFAQEKGWGEQLKLLPYHNFTKVNHDELISKYNLKEDPNNFDYILDVNQIAAMSGGKLKQKRKLLNRFMRNHGDKVKIKYMDIKEVQEHLLNFYDHWSKSKSEAELNTNELHAIKRLLKHYHFFNTTVMSIYIDDSLIGFTLFEEITDFWALSSFQKGDISYEGIYEFLNYNLAIHLMKKGIRYVNIEQDLGIRGLRRAKMDYNPTFLKKYTLSRKSAD